MTKKGERIGAVASGDEKEIHFFGYGTYVGDEVPTPDVIFMGERFIDLPNHSEMTNPKLVLDDGGVIYGCECWWGPESKVKPMIEAAKAKGTKITIITPKEYRNHKE